MRKSRASLERMRWSALLVLIAMAATAEGQTRAAKGRSRSRRSARWRSRSRGPRADRASDEEARRPERRPRPTEFTNDPIVGLSTRVDGKKHARHRRVHVRRRPEPRDHAGGASTRSRSTTSRRRSSSSRSASLGKHGEKARELLARELAEGLHDRQPLGHRIRPRTATARSSTKQIDASFKTLVDAKPSVRSACSARRTARSAAPDACGSSSSASPRCSGRSTRSTGRPRTPTKLRKQVVWR